MEDLHSEYNKPEYHTDNISGEWQDDGTICKICGGNMLMRWTNTTQFEWKCFNCGCIEHN